MSVTTDSIAIPATKKMYAAVPSAHAEPAAKRVGSGLTRLNSSRS